MRKLGEGSACNYAPDSEARVAFSLALLIALDASFNSRLRVVFQRISSQAYCLSGGFEILWSGLMDDEAVRMLVLSRERISTASFTISSRPKENRADLLMELEGGHRNSVIKRRNPIEFGLFNSS
ncbi:hypothetical protein EVAR_19061_1 [Eumeta japonica]|uniref:Uncharacterized protein n=1 Tax=Eumeta variegata TaxID=151549 RepID=A0A4C1UP11_EUMVA|nr:hypothetical protein EVAR_19061_1 [Eumeta japonica]